VLFAAAVRFGVVLACFRRVVRGVTLMAMRYVRVVTGLFVIARGVVLGGFAVMLRGELMVLGGLNVMIGSFCGHDGS
jgi:hypothetical protein